MKRLYSRLVLWLMQPALKVRDERRAASVRFYEAAVRSIGPGWRSSGYAGRTTKRRIRPLDHC